MESLSQQQRRFAQLVATLIREIRVRGYECTFGDAYRDPRVFGAVGEERGYGHPRSAHKQRLAIDLNLFKDGKFLTDSESHRPFGEWWKKQAHDARWGGDFSSRDGNHYSLERDGIK